MTTAEYLGLLQELAARTTPPPWVVEEKRHVEEARVFGTSEGSRALVALCDGRRDLRYLANAAFIAAAYPQMVAALARIALAAKEVDRVLGTYALDDQMLVPECKEMRSALAELSRVVDQQSRT